MIYLEKFSLLDRHQEEAFIDSERRTYIHNQYPFRLFPDREFCDISFEPITIIYGGNGSGKSTVLNIIAEKLRAKRNMNEPKGEMFERYIEGCRFKMGSITPYEIKVICSDDVFDYLFNIRRLNRGSYNRREELVHEYFNNRSNRITNFSEYQQMIDTIDSKSKTLSQYVKSRMIEKDIQEQSNGESALMYFISEIKENGIYILDEPENSMSSSMQLKLTKFIEESARFFNCQFIIATHSPFLLSLKDAKIYDLDSDPVAVKPWHKLENVNVYYNFFKDHEEEFKNN